METQTMLPPRLITGPRLQLAYIAISVLVTFLTAAFADPDATGALFTGWDLAHYLADNFFLFVWYYTDSNERGLRRPLALNIAVIALGAIGILAYVLWWDKGRRKSRVLRKLAFIAVLHVVAFVLGFFMTDMAL
jgi:uncharacterized membrane protein